MKTSTKWPRLQAGCVWRPGDVTPWKCLKHEEKKRCLPYGWTSHEPDTRPWNVMIEACQGPQFYEKRIEVTGNVWKNKSCILVTLGMPHPRGKLNHIKSTVAANEAMVYYPVSDYEKKWNRLNYKRDVRDGLVTSRPSKSLSIILKKSL